MRVLIGEDEPLLRDGLAALLARHGHRVVAAVADADALRGLAVTEQPDLTLTDIRMPPGRTDDGLHAAIWIRSQCPDGAVVVLSQYVERRYALELLADRSEGVGYLLKQRIGDTAAFLADLERVKEGGTVLDPEVVAAMVRRSQRDHDGIDRLTARQREVLALIAEGRSNAAISRLLTISEKAVVQHTSHIYDELGLVPSGDDHRRVLAVIRYLNR